MLQFILKIIKKYLNIKTKSMKYLSKAMIVGTDRLYLKMINLIDLKVAWYVPIIL